MPSRASSGQALQALATAERPVILAGGGVMWSRAEAELVELAEKLSIPVATSLHAKAAIAESNPLNVGVCGTYSRACANRVVAEADLVFFIGSQTGSMITTNWQVPAPGTRVVHLDIDPAQLGRHYPTEVPLNGDARATLRQMLAEASGRSNPRWIDRVRVLVQQWRDEVEEMLELNTGPIRPERIVSEIGSVLPTDGAVVVDTLQASVWSGSFMPLKGATPALHPLRRLAGLGIPGIDRREVRARQPTGASASPVTVASTITWRNWRPRRATRYRWSWSSTTTARMALTGATEPNPYRRDASDEADRSWKFGQHNFAQIAQGARLRRRPRRASDRPRPGHRRTPSPAASRSSWMC